MSDKSSIEWTDATWNPITGCTKVSPGCDHCYAERIVERFKGKGAFATVVRSEDKLYAPLKWRTPRRVFVNSMSDLFHDDVPLSFIHRVWSVMARAPQHTFQILTKRHGRMRSIVGADSLRPTVEAIVNDDLTWPLPNVWLGVSVEDQKWADIRIPALLDTPAAVRWISAEPLLGPIDLSRTDKDALVDGGLDWVVVGGESGPGARPMLREWATSLRQQCEAANVPFLFKQWGAWAPSPNGYPVSVVDTEGHEWQARMFRGPKAATGRTLDGQTWDQYPEAS
jgi:protein gp37